MIEEINKKIKNVNDYSIEDINNKVKKFLQKTFQFFILVFVTFYELEQNS